MSRCHTRETIVGARQKSHFLTFSFIFARFGCFGGFVSTVSLVSLVSVVSVVSVVSFRSFRSFRLFRWFRFGRFVSLFRVLVHATTELRVAEVKLHVLVKLRINANLQLQQILNFTSLCYFKASTVFDNLTICVVTHRTLYMYMNTCKLAEKKYEKSDSECSLCHTKFYLNKAVF